MKFILSGTNITIKVPEEQLLYIISFFWNFPHNNSQIFSLLFEHSTKMFLIPTFIVHIPTCFNFLISATFLFYKLFRLWIFTTESSLAELTGILPSKILSDIMVEIILQSLLHYQKNY